MTELATPFDADPAQAHEVLGALREAGPIHRITLPNGVAAWLVTRYEESRAVLADPRLFSGISTDYIDSGSLAPDVRSAVYSHMMHSDPVEHARLRKLVAKVFTTRRVENLRPRAEAIIDDLLDGVTDRTGFDLVTEVAEPLPMQVICELLGIPLEDREPFPKWTTAFVAASLLPEYPVEDITAFVTYFRRLVAHKRSHPDNALLSGLIAARDDDDRLTEDELISTAVILLGAGWRGTANLISTGMCTLLDRPQVADRLRADPEALPAAVEELLRYDGPALAAMPRYVTEPVEIGGCRLAAGELVVVSFLAANRDENVVPEPESFCPTRPTGPHLAFGHGIHHCLGAPLARLVAQIAIGALLRRFPTLRLAVPPDELIWKLDVFSRGLKALPVTAME
ncbi:cytochrome P450 [Amycolatopsis sp. NPDC049868]|uniref:cytochrome P450 n=1 Tax=Amycolatopsis sp. NPDC049868 TaxID=3363934 RepID=UPI00378EA9DC